MKITKEQVKHLARLSRLHVADDQIDSIRADMDKLIDFADKLSELDTNGIVPTTHAIPVHNVMRDDITLPSFDRSDILKNAPLHDESCILVPKVIE